MRGPIWPGLVLPMSRIDFIGDDEGRHVVRVVFTNDAAMLGFVSRFDVSHAFQPSSLGIDLGLHELRPKADAPFSLHTPIAPTTPRR
jgi:hypothetical protein